MPSPKDIVQFSYPLGNVRDMSCVLRNYWDLHCRDCTTSLFQGIQPVRELLTSPPIPPSPVLLNCNGLSNSVSGH